MFVGETLARQDGATITCVRSPTVSAAHCRPKRKGGGFSHFAPLQAAPLNRRSNDIAFLEGSELDLFFFTEFCLHFLSSYTFTSRQIFCIPYDEKISQFEHPCALMFLKH